jgi:riboflavin synthase
VFTGIINHQGTVESFREDSGGAKLVIRAPEIAAELEISASIAVNGCCLTVIAHDAQTFSADLSPETLRCTALGSIKPRTRVNLERPLRAGQELGGHFVQGHVDGVGAIAAVVHEGHAANANEQNWRLDIELPAQIARYLAEKGSLAIDGISLTVAALQQSHASFAVIPFTYAHTNISERKAGDAVNLEVDILAKYVERLMSRRTVSAESR